MRADSPRASSTASQWTSGTRTCPPSGTYRALVTIAVRKSRRGLPRGECTIGLASATGVGLPQPARPRRALLAGTTALYVVAACGRSTSPSSCSPGPPSLFHTERLFTSLRPGLRASGEGGVFRPGSEWRGPGTSSRPQRPTEDSARGYANAAPPSRRGDRAPRERRTPPATPNTVERCSTECGARGARRGSRACHAACAGGCEARPLRREGGSLASSSSAQVHSLPRPRAARRRDARATHRVGARAVVGALPAAAGRAVPAAGRRRWVDRGLRPSRRLIVEVDGDWHRGRERLDARRDRALARAGWRVLLLDAALVMRDLPAAVARVREALGTSG